MVSQPISVPADAKLSVELEAQQWNVLMAALNEAPHRVAAPIFQTMTEQLSAQAEALTKTNQSSSDHLAPAGDVVPLR